MLKEKPDLAKRYAAAWAKAVKDCNTIPRPADLLAADMNVPADLTSSIPLANFVMVKDLTPAQIEDFQKFLDIGTALGVVSGKVDAKAMVTAV